MNPTRPPAARQSQVVDLSCRRKAEDGLEGPFYVVKDKWQTYTDFVVRSVGLFVDVGGQWVYGRVGRTHTSKEFDTHPC